MAALPVFHDTPSKPLFIDSGGGVMVPAFAEDPCACCDCPCPEEEWAEFIWNRSGECDGATVEFEDTSPVPDGCTYSNTIWDFPPSVNIISQSGRNATIEFTGFDCLTVGMTNVVSCDGCSCTDSVEEFIDELCYCCADCDEDGESEAPAFATATVGGSLGDNGLNPAGWCADNLDTFLLPKDPALGLCGWRGQFNQDSSSVGDCSFREIGISLTVDCNGNWSATVGLGYAGGGGCICGVSLGDFACVGCRGTHTFTFSGVDDCCTGSITSLTITV